MPATPSLAGERARHGRNNRPEREQNTSASDPMEGVEQKPHPPSAQGSLPPIADPVTSTTTVPAIQPPDVTADAATRPADPHPDPASASSEPEIWRLADIMMKRASVPCDDPRLQLSVINFKNAIDRQEEELKRLKADLIHYRSVYDDLKRVSERIPEKEAQLQKRVKDLEAENRNLMWRLQDENSKLESMLQQLAPAAHKIKLQENQIEQQTARNDQQAMQIKQQTTWNEQQAEQIKQQSTQIEQQTTWNEQQAMRIKQQNTQIEQQTMRIKQQDTQIEKQATRLEQQKLHVKDLQTELEQLKRRFEQDKAERREDKDRVKQTLERTQRAENHPADGQPTSRRIFKKQDHLGPEENLELPDYSRSYRERLPERPYDRRRSLSPVRSPPDRYARERRTSPPRASTYRPDNEPIRRLRGDEPADIGHSKPPPRHPSSYSSVASKPMLGIHKVEHSEHVQYPLARSENASAGDSRRIFSGPDTVAGAREDDRDLKVQPRRKLVCGACHSKARWDACDGKFPCKVCTRTGSQCYYALCRRFQVGERCPYNPCSMVHDEAGYS